MLIREVGGFFLHDLFVSIDNLLVLLFGSISDNYGFYLMIIRFVDTQ